MNFKELLVILINLILVMRKFEHWQRKEDLHYHFYLILHKKEFFNGSNKRKEKVFKKMAKFIQTRTHAQCRSHHQKKTKTRNEQTILLRFIEEEYLVRNIPVQHIKVEVLAFLREVKELESQFVDEYMDKLNQFLEIYKKGDLTEGEEETKSDSLRSDKEKSEIQKEEPQQQELLLDSKSKEDSSPIMEEQRNRFSCHQFTNFEQNSEQIYYYSNDSI